jgi:ribosomal protein S9
MEVGALARSGQCPLKFPVGPAPGTRPAPPTPIGSTGRQPNQPVDHHRTGQHACVRSPPAQPTSSATGTSSTPRAWCSAARHRGGPPPARQAQADLRPPPRHRRPRHHRQRRQGRAHLDKAERKLVHRHSGYPGGIKSQTYAELLARKPEEAVRRTVRGMLPKNRLGRQMLKKLKVYAGPTHPHAAQQPTAARHRRTPVAREPIPKRSLAMSAPLVQSTGRRKRAVARVRFRPAPGHHRQRRRSRTTSPSETHRMILTEPLRLTETAEVYDIDATLHGGGPSGQAGALRLGIARASSSSIPSCAPSSRRPDSSPATPARRNPRSTA